MAAYAEFDTILHYSSLVKNYEARVLHLFVL